MEQTSSINASSKPAAEIPAPVIELELDLPTDWDHGPSPAATLDEIWQLSLKIRHLDRSGHSTPVSEEFRLDP
jgi:hypothetical protein